MAKKERKAKNKKQELGNKRSVTQFLKLYYKQMLFVASVCVLMALWYYMASTKWYVDTVLPPYSAFLAMCTSKVLNVFGYDTVAVTNMISGKHTVSVAMGCDALEPTFLLLVVIAAYPLYHKYKLLGITAGAVVLWAVNIFRLCSLYMLISVQPTLFELFHMEIWQPLFILFALLIFFFWISYATKKSTLQVVPNNGDVQP